MKLEDKSKMESFINNITYPMYLEARDKMEIEIYNHISLEVYAHIRDKLAKVYQINDTIEDKLVKP